MQNQRKRERIDELLTDNILIGSRKSRESNSTMAIGAQFVFDISSKLLQRICIAEKILFELNDSDVQSDRCLHQYYTNNLVEPSTVVVGALLRDWKAIPGRDSVFDGIPTTNPLHPLDSSQATINDEPFNEMVENEPEECVERTSPDPDPSEIVAEIENDNVIPMEVVEEVASADTDETVIVDTNDIEAELNLINSRMRSSQNYVDAPATSAICDSETIAYESHRGPSPDLFDDEDDDCDANYFESESLTCAY